MDFDTYIFLDLGECAIRPALGVGRSLGLPFSGGNMLRDGHDPSHAHNRAHKRGPAMGPLGRGVARLVRDVVSGW